MVAPQTRLANSSAPIPLPVAWGRGHMHTCSCERMREDYVIGLQESFCLQFPKTTL